MQSIKIPFQNIPQLSKKDIAYATGAPELEPFFKYAVNIESFKTLIADKQKESTNRDVLVNTLLEQYQSLSTAQKVIDNIKALAKNTTFTVTTAHQPSLFTGPLYYIYKIISTIRLSEDLKDHYPDFDFVPVFVSGAEDHDFEEIQYANIFNKKLIWENDESGAVGMMKTESLQPVLEELKNILGASENANVIYSIFKDAFAKNATYGAATVQVVHELFKSYGLVVLDMNKAALKRLFIPIMEKELKEQVSKKMISASQKALEEIDFGGQSHARDINLFYLRDQMRKRIIFEENSYEVLDSDYVFSETEMMAELQEHPERFSPNVVMRPLYQELILPNLVYIGGGGEIAYWLERKTQFEFFGINFPMLIRRNSVMWLDKGSLKKIAKLGLAAKDVFTDTDSLVREYVDKNTSSELSLFSEKMLINEAFESILNKAIEIDASLKKSILAEQSRQLKNLEQVEGRLHRAEKQKHETAINQIRNLKEKLCPKNGLQERHDNFLSFYLKYGNEYFDLLKEKLNPLEKGFIVILEE